MYTTIVCFVIIYFDFQSILPHSYTSIPATEGPTYQHPFRVLTVRGVAGCGCRGATIQTLFTRIFAPRLNYYIIVEG